MNFRIKEAGDILAGLDIRNVLDVGCRGCEAKAVMRDSIEYYGSDLFQNASGTVDYVGDVMEYNFERTYDCVMALDIVEHVDNPYGLMEKLVGLTSKYLVVSLPNVYQLPHKFNFLFNNTLGDKYVFLQENQMDRHRWIMNYDEIHAFYGHYSKKFNLGLKVKDVLLSDASSRLRSRIITRFWGQFISNKDVTRTVIAVFKK